jgi:putative DNA primase/helicase
MGDGYVAIDVDTRHGGLDTLDTWSEWVGDTWVPPVTRRQRTGSGGLHLIYTVPPDVKIKSRDAVLPGIDIKGDGGYVIVEPSRHIAGSFYRWENVACPIVTTTGPLLTWLLTARGGRHRQSGAGGETPSDYAFDDGAAAGQRDAFFNDLAFRLRKSGASYERALQRVRDEWERCEQPANDPFPWETALAKLDRVWHDIEPDAIAPGRTAWAQAQVRQTSTVIESALVPHTVAPSSDDPVSSPPVSGPPGSVPRGPVRVVEDWESTEHLTDMGNGRRFVRLFGDKVRYCLGNKQWYVWDGVKFAADDVNEVMRLTQGVIADIRDEAAAADNDHRDRLVAHALRSESVTAREKMVKSASAEMELAVRIDQLDANPMIAVVRNGTIDLTTRELRPSCPEDLCTRSFETVFDIDATCPLWLKHIEMITRRKDGSHDPALAAHLQRWAGYTLTGLVREQKFFFAYGDGDNGKNVFIETLLGMLGSYGIIGSAQIMTGSGKEHETIIADLAGARMVFIDETPKGRANENRIKQLTGATRIRARHVAKDSVEFDARFKLWIAGNNRPTVADTSEGFWRRLDLVPFDTKITNKIKDYASILQNERPGILNWCLEGLRDYMAVGLAQPDRVAQASEEYRENENTFKQFIDEYFEHVGEPVWTPNSALHWAYEQWCKDNGVRNIQDMTRLANEWRRVGFNRDDAPRKIAQGYPRAVKKAQRGWIGSRLQYVPLELRWNGMYELSDESNQAIS